MNDIVNELNVFACGLNAEQKAREALELKIWELILNGVNEKWLKN